MADDVPSQAGGIPAAERRECRSALHGFAAVRVSVFLDARLCDVVYTKMR